VSALRHYWLVMRYACDKCGHRVDFYLEDGCEGPKEREVAPPAQWEKWRKEAPAEVRARMPATVPQTLAGRFILPVPFVAAGCPRCQPRKPWGMGAGVLQHVDWHDEPRVDTTSPPASAGRFLYPGDWKARGACGIPVLPGEQR
jgi:hypothetical protein